MQGELKVCRTEITTWRFEHVWMRNQLRWVVSYLTENLEWEKAGSAVTWKRAVEVMVEQEEKWSSMETA
jgi:hypothetical protein